MKKKNLNNKRTIFFATRPIAPPWNEGSKNLVYRLANEINLFSLILLTYKDQMDLMGKENIYFDKIYPNDKNPFNNNISGHNIDYKNRCPSSIYLPLSLKQNLSFLYAIIKNKASIYHFYFSPELITAKILRLIKKFKRGKFLQTFATPIQNKKMIERLVFGDAIVVQSNYNLKLLQENGVKNVHKIYPGVDTDYFRPGILSNEVRKNFKIPGNSFVVLSCGNYSIGCNDELVSMIKFITKRNSKIVFILASRLDSAKDKIVEDNIKSVLEKEQNSGQVIFVENVYDIRQLITISDIHIFLPNALCRKADIPVVLLESLAMEKPIVITDIAPFNEIMKSDVGEVVCSGNIDMLIGSILRLYEDKDGRIAKGRRGREMVISEFNLKNYVAEYEKLYERLL